VKRKEVIPTEKNPIIVTDEDQFIRVCDTPEELSEAVSTWVDDYGNDLCSVCFYKIDRVGLRVETDVKCYVELVD
jgi:hypothetical protein